MTHQAILQAARTGDPRAIATLLNQALNSQGIQVQAVIRDGCLQILLESEGLPDPSTCQDALRHALTTLTLSLPQPTRLYGRKLGERQPAWSQFLTLDLPASEPSEHPQFPTPTAAAQHLRRQSHPFHSSSSSNNSNSSSGEARSGLSAKKPVALSTLPPKPTIAPKRIAQLKRPLQSPKKKKFLALPMLLLLQVAGLLGLILWVRSQAKPLPATARSGVVKPTTTIGRDLTPTNLATYLQKQQAIMYGTYWCSACSWQKDQFGPTAFAMITYVECDPSGPNARPDLCQQAGVYVYPTWKIPTPSGIQTLEGGYDLVGLAYTSGFNTR